ncbi:MAG: hypothetical protein ACK5NT_03430 [Pyrinomonadaceae bacterium]
MDELELESSDENDEEKSTVNWRMVYLGVVVCAVLTITSLGFFSFYFSS